MSGALITWAPRVSREQILHLYQLVADGVNDIELINDVALQLYNRCVDILRVTEGRFACPNCRQEMKHYLKKGEDLHCCTCGWRMAWSEYSKSFQRGQLTVNTDTPLRYMNSLQKCKNPEDKVILIDSLIHACHESIRKGIKYYTRPLAVNLIEGTLFEVIAFLEQLPYGPGSSPEMSLQLIQWRQRCLSIISDLEKERDRVTVLVDSMPASLLSEIEGMITNNLRQKAARRLAMFREYNEKLKVLKGSTGLQMVKIIEKRMKAKAKANKQVMQDTVYRA